MAGLSKSRADRRAVALLLAPVLASTPTMVAAQTAPQIVPPTREEVTRPPSEQSRQRAPQLEVEGEIERAPCALDSPEYQNVRFTVRGVEFEGLDGIQPPPLDSSYANLVGTEQPISVVCEIRDRAATVLRDAGYIAAVQVPEQRIEDGIVHFRVLLARLTQVRVRGNASGAEQAIAGYLNELTKQPVFNRFDAERYLLLASDLPGYVVRLTLRPAGGAPGEVIGDVTVQRTPAYADFNIQNGGSRELGRWGGLLRAQLFGLTGLGDRTTIAGFTTADFDEQQTVQLGHDFRLGPQGLGVSGLFTYAWAHPDIDGEDDVKARTLLATLQADYPFVRSLARTLRGAAGLDIINQDVDLNSIDLSRDRLRVAFGRLSLDAVDTSFAPGFSLAVPVWRFNGQLELRKGLDIFGATDSCGPTGAECLEDGEVPPSRIEGRSTAAVVRTLLYGEFRPDPKFTFALGVRGQYAWKPLLSFEEFSAGNYTVGRGYDPGALLGDRGWGTQAELRIGSTVPVNAHTPAVEGYAFWDHARVSNLDRLTVVEGSKHLNSVGGGVRVAFDRFMLDTTLAFPLTHVGVLSEKPDPRVLISLSTRLWPWSYK
ncbi:MAG TPA: ShlB/FhaC/HecB family hemolysin secretion/activation protein [Sphingomicrobium sp.]|nr:ShlB/FhaC/HecB family hemolysin secretion/activation protein [Sphingomicrobium sp.]